MKNAQMYLNGIDSVYEHDCYRSLELRFNP